MTAIAINGVGRMGKLLLRELWQNGLARQVVLLNEPATDAANLAHLLAFDSVHGRWDAAVEHRQGVIDVNGHRMAVSHASTLADIPLATLGVDVLIDCSGAYRRSADFDAAFDAGVGKVIVACPVKDEGAINIVYGINHDRYDPAAHHVITGASCTTNCLAPLVQVLQSAFGIRHAAVTTLHDITNTQTLLDRPGRDPRRARAALNNLIPTSTGSATAIGLIFPELAGRIDGLAVRVPVQNASLVDGVFELERATSADEINAAFEAAAYGALSGILGYEDRPLVSCDFRGDPRSAIVDAACTRVINGTQAKVLAWYDNEWGYIRRLGDLTRRVTGAIDT